MRGKSFGRRDALVVATLLSLSAPSLLAAGPEPTVSAPPPATRQARDTIGASINNAGLQNMFELAWRRGLSSASDALHRDAHVALGLTHAVSPSYTRGGIWAEVSPLSIVNVRVGAEPAAYFGTFDSLMPFDGYDQPFDTKDRQTRGELAAAGTAARFYVSPTVRLKAGPVAAQAGADFEWWRSSAHGALFYEPARDTLIGTRNGRVLNTSAVVLVQRASGGGTMSAGVLHRLTYVSAAPQNRIQQLGVVAMREYQARRFGLNRPTLIANVSYYLNDPWKRHTPGATLAVAFDVHR